MVIGDWGMAAMTYVGFFAISPTGRLYLYRELFWVGEKIGIWGPLLKSYIDRENVRTVRFCRSTAQDHGQEHTIQSQIETELGRSIELSTNKTGSRIAGKMLVHEYLRWEQKPFIPASEIPVYDEGYAQWLLRMKGIDDYNAYLMIFEPHKEEDNLPKLQIFKSCELMQEAIKACTYEKASKEGKAAEDVKEFDGDDPYDTLRYAVDSAERYFVESAREFSLIQKQQKLIEALKNTKDWTAYYMNMRIAEAGESKMKVVARYHNRRR